MQLSDQNLSVSIDSNRAPANDLANCDNLDKHAGIARLPVEAPVALRPIVTEFQGDNANFVDPIITKALGQRGAVDYKMNMEADVHARLGQTRPLDLMKEDLHAFMQANEPAEWKNTDFVSKLGRSAKPDKLDVKVNPMVLANNQLSRQTGQDQSVKQKKPNAEFDR